MGKQQKQKLENRNVEKKGGMNILNYKLAILHKRKPGYEYEKENSGENLILFQ